MHKVVEHTKADFAMVRTGRASPALVEKIRVDYDGSEVPLQQIAGFSFPEPRVLVVNPYDKGAMRAVERALISSTSASTRPTTGRCSGWCSPSSTQERRKEFVKVVKHRAEEGRVAVRNVRRATRHDLEALEREGDISSDDLERAEKVLESLTHDQIAEIDRLLSHKERELLEL